MAKAKEVHKRTALELRSNVNTNENYTARSVIAPGPDLRIDEVWLSYPCLCGLLQQRIINILHKSYSMKYNDAYKLLMESMHHENPTIRQIIEGIIRSTNRGIPILINRNPTIAYGGILQMYCSGISEGYTMLVPLQILEGLAADFDRDLSSYRVIYKSYRWLIAGRLNSKYEHANQQL